MLNTFYGFIIAVVAGPLFMAEEMFLGILCSIIGILFANGYFETNKKEQEKSVK